MPEARGNKKTVFSFFALTPATDFTRFILLSLSIMRKSLLILFPLALFFLLSPAHLHAFCGFYVAKADATLFNKASQVIVVRHEGQTVVTMSSDYSGNIGDFAMIIPVPEVLTRDRIRIADADIFSKLDAYTGPRLVEYYDANPCEMYIEREEMMFKDAAGMPAPAIAEVVVEEDDLGVTIVESYSIGEYDILILSAEESDGLETWLTRNGYKLPKKAAEVLEPYVKSDMKFFVVKVNLEAHQLSGAQTLNPIQMTFRSDRFMLPIRLGMANANGDQDMIVYAFSQKGRVESTNYRTLNIPTDRNVPLPVKAKFGEFYQALFEQSWKKSPNAVFNEYAWNISSSNYVKCDPCSTTPPTYAELREAGVFWVSEGGNSGWGGSDYQGDVFVTRMHVRYNRSTFPQDLLFQATPDRSNFQGRYILTHPASGNLTCDAGKKYKQDLSRRRQKEVQELAALTGWNATGYRDYMYEYGSPNRYIEALPNDKDRNLAPVFRLPKGSGSGWPYALLAVSLVFILLIGIGIRRLYWVHA